MDEHNDTANLTEIRLAPAELELTWDDGTHYRYASALLRSRCMCAECRSTNLQTGQRALPVKTDVKITNILPVGSYAVQLVFDDGHDRGIYPFSYLHELAAEQARR